MDTTLRRNGIVALAIVTLFIVYGSTYPFNFVAPAHPAGPFQTLWQTWNARPGRGDLIANIFFYLPFGFFAARTFRANCNPAWAFVWALLAGAILSVGCEILQYYVPGRAQSADDVYANTFGTALGAALGLILGRGFFSIWPRNFRDDPFPAVLLACWVGYRFFPYVPVIDLHKYWDALKPVFDTGSLTAQDVFLQTATWILLATLFGAIIGRRLALALFPVLVGFVVAAEVAITGLHTSLPEIAGAAPAFVMLLVLTQFSKHQQDVAIFGFLLAFVIVWRLTPFQFSGTPHAFSFVPFQSFIGGSPVINMKVFLEKCFYYGGLIWLLAECGMSIGRAGIVIAPILLATSAAQAFLPERSAEITDAVMPLLIAYIVWLAKDDGAKQGRNIGTSLNPHATAE